MKTPQIFLLKSSVAVFLAAIIFVTAIPASALAASTSASSAAASISAPSLLTESGDRAYLSGTTTSAVSKVRVIVTAASSTKELYRSSSTRVGSKGTWAVRVSKTLSDGTYSVSVYDTSSSKTKLLTTGTLYVGVAPAMLTVSSIPLLAGGIAGAGSNIPVSYLQVVNTGSATTTITGFWLREDGSAPAAAIAGFSSIDDKGGSFSAISALNENGNYLFTDGKAFVPSNAAVLAPGQRKLFTIKAQLGHASAQYAGLPLMLNVVGVEAAASTKAAFPIIGTTWILRSY